MREINSIQVPSDVGGIASPRKGRVLRKVLSPCILRPHPGGRRIFLMISNQQQYYHLQTLTEHARHHIVAAIKATFDGRGIGGAHYAVK